MVLLFAYWCKAQGIDPHALYQKAYPQQGKNQLLDDAWKAMMAEDVSLELSTEALITLLQTFGNDDLAFEVYQVAQKVKETKTD